MLGKGGNLDDVHKAWGILWSLEVSPKVRHFLWRVCTNSLPVRAVLRARHLIDQDECPWCLHDVETIHHSLFTCDRWKSVWGELGCQAMVDGVVGETMCETVVRWSELDAKMVQRGSFLAWNVWTERNKLVFEGQRQPVPVIVQRVGRQCDEFNSYTTRIYGGPKMGGCVSSTKWCAPPRGMIKLNTDAYLGEEGWIGLGIVARDFQGKVCFSAVRRTRACWPAAIAECKAIYMAARMAKAHGLANVIIESDSQVVTTRLTNETLYFADLDNILGDVLSLCNVFESVKFLHVKRDGNAVAHHLARVVPFGVEQCWENHCPREVAPYVLMDTLSLD
ncbi:uncharacterized protein LOC130589574 [Beta vulgaris subsp. vulgaris]|uniref:uncharacterized protein LOC130589574 n=1 Tax=Beta vulgaris subsp. vulgaris TaxID=3555 RepID=UPI0025479BA6|nr:uncharacterized protein LOC130589574 [Beta vulgaris subsp. vulgaris]